MAYPISARSELAAGISAQEASEQVFAPETKNELPTLDVCVIALEIIWPLIYD